MPNTNIILKAKLQAYSRAPFYGDYVRQPSSITSGYNKDIFYVLKDGNWVNLEEASSQLGISIEKLVDQIELLDDKVFGKNGVVQNINVDIKHNQLIFTDGSGISKTLSLPGTNVDNDSIGLNAAYELTTLDKPDDKTLKIVDVEYEDDGIRLIKKSGKLRVDAIYDSANNVYLDGFELSTRLNKTEKTLKSLEEYTLGTGGFLDPYNFGNLNIDPELRNSILNNQAYEQLSNGIPKQIDDQTKIKNLYDGHIWVYIQKENNWVDEGADTIVNANNDGVLGAVTGVSYNPTDLSTKFKISIEADSDGISTGKMSVNGLSEEFSKVAYIENFDAEVTPNSYIKRTTDGAVKVADAKNGDEAINLNQIHNLLDSLTLTDIEIAYLVHEEYKPVENGGNK